MARLIDDLRTLALSEAGTLAAPPRADRSRPAGRARSSARSRRRAGDGRGDRHGRGRRRPADPRRRPGPDPRGARQSRRQRHPPHAGGWPVDGSAGGRQATVSSCEVSDTGPGIDPDLLPHVFDRFVKGDGLDADRGWAWRSRVSWWWPTAGRSMVESTAERARRSGSGCPWLSLRAGDPDVVDGGLDRARGPRSAAANTIRTVCAGPRRHRDRRRGPGRQVRVRRAGLLADERPGAVVVLDERPEVVGGRRVRGCGRGSSGTSACRPSLGSAIGGERTRRHAAIDVVAHSTSSRPLAPVTRASRAGRRGPGLAGRRGRVGPLPAAGRRGVGAERVRLSSRRRSRSRRTAARSGSASCRSRCTGSRRPRSGQRIAVLLRSVCGAIDLVGRVEAAVELTSAWLGYSSNVYMKM